MERPGRRLTVEPGLGTPHRLVEPGASPCDERTFTLPRRLRARPRVVFPSPRSCVPAHPRSPAPYRIGPGNGSSGRAAAPKNPRPGHERREEDKSMRPAVNTPQVANPGLAQAGGPHGEPPHETHASGARPQSSACGSRMGPILRLRPNGQRPGLVLSTGTETGS